MAETQLQVVKERYGFYRDNYTRMLGVLLFSLIANIGLGATLFYMITHPPKPKYFAASVNGRITPLVALTRPNQADAGVLQWAAEAAIASYTFNYVNYREELQAASIFFTARGWKNFKTALDASNNLEAVKKKRWVVSAVATKAPTILNKGLLGAPFNRYAWRIEMPLEVTYQGGQDFARQQLLISMLVIRVSSLNYPTGIGIEQFVATPISGNIG